MDDRASLMTKKSKKSPFIGLTEKQAAALEDRFYMISIGNEFLHDEDGHFAFPKKTAALYKNKAVKGLREMVKTGDKKSKEEAKAMLCAIKIVPFIIQ